MEKLTYLPGKAGTRSVVLKTEKELNEFLMSACMEAQKNGGQFSINMFFKEMWYVEYVIVFGDSQNRKE